MQRTTLTTLVLVLGLALITRTTHGGEIGHYAAGLPNIRDLVVPEPGFYGILYNYFYTSDRLNDSDGDEINSVTITPRGGPGVTLSVDVDLDVYVLAPALLWVSPWKILGAKYGAFITPTFANSSVGASLATVTGRGVDADTSQFDVGDLFVQPLWLGWTLTHWDFTFGYGFYAPIGKYDTSTATLPGGATVTAESADNIGLGFWTHQLQGAVTWVSVGPQGHGRGRRPDLRNPWRQGGLRPDAGPEPHLELGHQSVSAAHQGPEAPARSRSRRLQQLADHRRLWQRRTQPQRA